MALLTLSDIKTAIKTDLGIKNITTYDTRIGELVNEAQMTYCSKEDWPFMEEHGAVIELVAEYDTGTVAITENATTVTGSSTVWTKAMTGRKIKMDDYEAIYKIAKFTSSTSIELANNYLDDTITAGEYTIFKDIYTCPVDWKEIHDIWIYDTPIHLKKVGIDVFNRLYYNSEPTGDNPLVWSPGTSRPLTRINVDNASGTFTKDEFVTGASGGYGILRKANAYTSTTWMYIEILYGSFADNEVLTGDSSSATCSVNESNGYNNGNIGGFITIHLYPAPFEAILLACDVKKKVIKMDADTDEPMIPEEHRPLLVYDACAKMCPVLNKNDIIPYYEGLARERYLTMVNDLIPYQARAMVIRSGNRRKEI